MVRLGLLERVGEGLAPREAGATSYRPKVAKTVMIESGGVLMTTFSEVFKSEERGKDVHSVGFCVSISLCNNGACRVRRRSAS